MKAPLGHDSVFNLVDTVVGAEIILPVYLQAT